MKAETPGDKWRVSLTIYAPFFIWICVILFLSSSQASATETSRILGPLLKLLFPSASEATLQTMHFYIRKLAHLTEYAILGFFALRAFAHGGWGFARKYHVWLTVLTILTIASIDEINQSFEPSRTSSIWDVALDFTGGTIAVMVVLFYLRLARRRAS